MTIRVGLEQTTAHLAITMSLGPEQILQSLKLPLESLDAVLRYELSLQATRRLAERVERVLARKGSSPAVSAAVRSGLPDPGVGSLASRSESGRISIDWERRREEQARREEGIATLTQALLSASGETPRTVLFQHLAQSSELAEIGVAERLSVTVESLRYSNPWEVVLIGMGIGYYAVRGLAWTLRAWQEHQLRDQQIQAGQAKLEDRDLDRQLKIEELRACRLENELREHELQNLHRRQEQAGIRLTDGAEARQIAAIARTSELGPEGQEVESSDQEQVAVDALTRMRPIVEVREID